MEGIPPARASDNEDVIWALETAESLWKRNSRGDAIVWLRRAAQEASEAGDGERAAALLVDAAALTEGLGRSSGQTRAAAPVTPPPPDLEDAAIGTSAMSDLTDDVDALLADDEPTVSVPPGERGLPRPLPPLPVVKAPPARDEILELDADDLISLPPPTPVPTGDAPGPREERTTLVASHDDVPIAVIGNAPMSLGDPPISLTNDSAVSFVDAEPVSLAEDTPHVAVPVAVPEIEGVTLMGADALSPMDLMGIPLLSGASDEQRTRLVRQARVILCMAEVVLPPFALAVVLEGEVLVGLDDVSPITRVGPGSVLRARGTLGAAREPLQFTVTTDDTTLAVWSEDGLESALRGGAPVDDGLRRDADRLIAWASLARSPLADRLHADVRLRLALRLDARALLPGEELVASGQPVAGIFLVAEGTVVLDGDATVIGTGGFVFPEGALSAGRASCTARAGDAGALLVAADRRTTQELCATEPLLLEVLAASC